MGGRGLLREGRRFGFHFALGKLAVPHIMGISYANLTSVVIVIPQKCAYLNIYHTMLINFRRFVNVCKETKLAFEIK